MSKLLMWMAASDKQMLFAIHSRWRTRLMDICMKSATMLGSAGFTIMAALLLLAARQSRWEAAAALATSHVMVQILKKCFGRVRPYRLGALICAQKELHDYSFPSGHTTAAFSILASIGFAWPWLFWVSMPLAGMVGLSRIYLGHHYPSDVAVGAVIGIAAAAGVHLILY